MKSLVLILALSLVLSTFAKDVAVARRSTQEGTGLMDTLSAGLDLFGGGGSVLGAVQGVKDLFHTESHSSYGDRQRGLGFDMLSVSSAKTTGVLEPHNIDRYINFTVYRNPQLKEVDEVTREAIAYSMEELLLFSVENDKSSQNFNVQFSSSAGDITFLSVTFRIRDDGNYDVFRASCVGKFKLAKDYFVISHSKQSFFKSKSWDELVYVDRGLSTADIGDILNIVFMPSKLLLELESPHLSVDKGYDN
eukprot:TRINITY_DN10731_c0_g1_i1.p1 TRINITY_DN10731_c0_g1~~TRINITY_DN10731_c0_g1_i1.p1  ORF type:complete len:271 (-),score=95.95 TRINITY_DN10731_c0_g1_i1:51-797(-)